MTAPGGFAGPTHLAYVATFTLAAVACLASAWRLDQVEDRQTRRGLRALLLLSAGWAGAHVAFLVLPTTSLKVVAYSVGLVLGIATVGAWLYVCSAFTGRSFHQHPTYRRLAVAVFLAIVALKLTNPLHHEYYTYTTVGSPFPHLAIEHGALHWVTMGLAYALAFVGYFMLVELFTQIDLDTRPLAALLVVTGLPVALDVVGFASPLLLDITYEPLGVAVFAVGVAFVYLDRFDEVQLAGERDDPIVALDTDGRIRDTNRLARSLFPALEGAEGRPIETVLPAVADRLDDDAPIVEVRQHARTRYFRVTESPYGVGSVGLGQTLVFTDITERERYRRELERQNDRLETFASMVSHDLRNPLNVAQGQFAPVREALPDDDPTLSDAAEDVDASLDRMATLIDEILTLARSGQTVQETEPIEFPAFVAECWQMIEQTDATLQVDADCTLWAAPDRLRRLLENLFRNALDHAGTDVTITVGLLDDGTGFYVADDGPGIPESDRDDVFESGYTTTESGTGFGLAIVAEIVEAHNWTIDVTDSDAGGARFEIRRVRLED